MMEIKTNRSFIIKLKNGLIYGISNPDCLNRRHYPLFYACPHCTGTISDDEELRGFNAVYESDGLTYSNLKYVWIRARNQDLICSAETFEVVREL